LSIESGPTPADNQIVVFISSHQKEFEPLRSLLKDTLEGEDFLDKLLMKVELVERRSGERIRGDITMALRSSMMYVGMFGNKYSEITVAEYRDARRRGLPLLVFDMVRRGKRDSRVKDFLDGEVKKIDDGRVTTVPFSPSRTVQAADVIIQRVANTVADMVRQNLEMRRTVHPQ
jgi:hypothetical protein